MNDVGCAVGGSPHPAVDIAIRAFGPYAGKPTASILGRAERLDPLHASLMNGIRSRVYGAALLAQAGFTAGEHGIEGPRGFAAVQAATYDLSRITFPRILHNTRRSVGLLAVLAWHV